MKKPACLPFLAWLLAPAFLGSAYAREPLHTGDETAITTALQRVQKANIRESSGKSAYECFTSETYAEFQKANRPRKIAEALQGDRKFIEGVIALRGRSAAEQAGFIKATRHLRPTWKELGRISAEGQTEAGQAAELDIANAVADALQEQMKLSAGEIRAHYENH